MKKQLVLVGVAVLLIVVSLSGCFENNDNQNQNTEEKPVECNLGDSITHGTIRLTFLSATWKKPYEWLDDSSYYYSLEVKGENIGSAEDSVFVQITKYEMANGYTYSSDYISGYFSLNPGRNNTLEISSASDGMSGQIIDRDFLPVAKIYVTLDENANPFIPEENPIHLILNV